MALTYCLDTSAYSHFKRGDPRVAELLDGADWVGVPAVVPGELRTAFALGMRTEANARELAESLRHPLVHVLDVDSDVASIYADIIVALKRAGTPPPTNDVWIAATAARYAAAVVSYDEHFRAVGRVGSIVFEAPSPT